jgi:hypothetical protein
MTREQLEELLKQLEKIRYSDAWSFIMGVQDSRIAYKTTQLRAKLRTEPPETTYYLAGDLDGYEESAKLLDSEISKLHNELHPNPEKNPSIPY